MGRNRLFDLAIAAAAALLPAPALAERAEIHTFHCLHSCPVGAPATNDLVVREIYTLSSNDDTKFADWVAYRVSRALMGGTESRVWAADPWLAPEETLEPPDYTDANRVLRTDRGHQAPLASLSGTGLGFETNYLSNITPQRADLNQGTWVRLENAERALAGRISSPVYVLTGPLYERQMQPLPRADEPHRVPSGYWKLVMTEDNRLTAFIMDQETPRAAPHCGTRVSLEEVERRSGLSFFPRLQRRAFQPLDAALGC